MTTSLKEHRAPVICIQVHYSSENIDIARSQPLQMTFTDVVATMYTLARGVIALVIPSLNQTTKVV